MIIDIYVYFVSYYDTVNIDGENHKSFNNREYVFNKEISTILDIRDIEDAILLDVRRRARLEITSVNIINFQLLDSYNKEEREGVK